MTAAAAPGTQPLTEPRENADTILDGIYRKMVEFAVGIVRDWLLVPAVKEAEIELDKAKSTLTRWDEFVAKVFDGLKAMDAESEQWRARVKERCERLEREMEQALHFCKFCPPGAPLAACPHAVVVTGTERG